MTPRDIIGMPDLLVRDGLSRTVCALIAARDGNVDLDRDEFEYDLDGQAAEALEARITTRVKSEETWDNGDGRDGVDVVCLDGRAVAVVRESGYDSYAYQIALLDRAALDEMVAAARALRRSRVSDMEEVDLDDGVAERLGLDHPAAPACG